MFDREKAKIEDEIACQIQYTKDERMDTSIAFS